jgi:hypothetical protein
MTMSKRRGVIVIVVLLVVAVGAATASIVLALSAGDPPRRAAVDATAARLDNPALVSSYVAAATAGIQAVTAYDYRSLPDALDNGLQVTTGAYQRSYRQALTGDNAALVVRDHVVQTFDLLKVGIGAMAAGGKRATVLVFGVEHVTNTGGQRADPLTLTATLQRVGNRYLISRLEEDANAGLPPGNAALRGAAEAGREEIANLLSFTRAQFAADRKRALDGATAGLRTDLGRRLAVTKAALDKGRYDLSGAVTAVAVESVAGTRVAMLIAATGERIDAAGTKTVVTDGRFAVSVVLVGDSWLVEQVSAMATS